MASLQPYVDLIPGERGNIFAALFCAFALAIALPTAQVTSLRATRTEILISLVLLLLALLSSLMSSTPRSSCMRALVVMSAGLGGFWSARILLHSTARQMAFAWLCAVMMSGVAFLSLWGYTVYGRVDYYIFLNSHQVINTSLLLLFGPLTLINRRKFHTMVPGILLTILCVVVLFLAALQTQISGILAPLGAVILLAIFAIFRSKTVAGQFLLLIVAMAIAACFFAYWNKKDTSRIEYETYRIESYPFSWHVAKKHPLFGVGLRTPRDELLTDYEIKHPALTREQFASELHTLVTPENAFLALLTGLGIPFFALYCCALALLLIWLVRTLYRPPPTPGTLSSWVLLVPLAGSLLHSLTTDTLMLPQIVWYFHLLLGLIAKPEPVEARERVGWETVAVRGAVLAGAVALGIFLGTQPYFSPEKLPNGEEIHAFLKEVPVIKLLYYKKEQPAVLAARSGSPSGMPVDQVPYGFAPGDARLASYGALLVNIEGYEGKPTRWAILIVLDNSKSMNEEMQTGGKTRRDVALDLIESLVGSLPPSSKVALRAFSSEGIARKKSQEIPLRISVPVLNWTDVPVPQLPELLKKISFRGTNNVCAATRRSIQRDPNLDEELERRIVLVTDGLRECSFREIIEKIKKENARDQVKVDVLAVDMPRPLQTKYSNLCADTGGSFVDTGPQMGERQVLAKYLAVLQTPRPSPLEVLAGNARYKIFPGRESIFLAGSYTIAFPEMQGLDASNRTIKDVRIAPGKTTVLHVSAQEGRLVIQ